LNGSRKSAELGQSHHPTAHPQHVRDPEQLGFPGVGARAERDRTRGWACGISQAPHRRRQRMTVAYRLAELGLALQPVVTPVAAYVAAPVCGNPVFTA